MLVVDPPLGWDIVLLLICSTHAVLYILCSIRLLIKSKNPYVAYRSPSLILFGQVNFNFDF